MARARTTTRASQDILSRMTGMGAEALHKLSDIPGGSKLVELANDSKTRIDEMQKKLRGLDALEKRVARLERQLAAATAKKPKPAATPKAAAKPAPTAKPAASKPAAKRP